MRSWRARISALGCAVGMVLAPLAAVPAEAGPGAGADRPAKPVTVMTRNIYLGADINRPVVAARTAELMGKTPQEVLVALGNATHVTREIVDDTAFPIRAGMLADEIAETRPDLVGLQEVALWRSGPVQLGQVGVPNATDVDYDYLQLLLDELEERGAAYEAVNIGLRADVEAPSFTGNPFLGTMQDARDVRMTMRDVILMRVDDGLTETGEGDRIFATNLEVTIAGQEMNFDRGFQWVDVRAGAQRFRFVNSHFEAFSSDIAYAQAAELLGAVPTDRTVVFVCDCNSDPLNNSIKTGIGDTLPHKAAYDLITGAGGFTDQWLEWAPASEGWTSGLNERVDEPAPGSWTHRIDMVFGRPASGEVLRVDRGQVVGEAPEDRDDVNDLWPSDHAGVVLRLRGL
jgi:endonuclease/exonuclease/phosphatase family metal-dependent hydrolase